MKFLKRKPQQPGDGSKRLARTIADHIIHWQNLLAGKMNNRIKRFSKKQQKWLLCIFCGLSSTGLVICLVLPFSRISTYIPGGNYQPTHIGLPSDLPPKPYHLKRTDSLNTKI
jgi:hypothetical protein